MRRLAFFGLIPGMKWTRSLLGTLILFWMAGSPHALAGALDPINLWPGTPPGDKESLPPEIDLTKDSEGFVGGKRLIRLGNVSTPTLTVYPAPAEKNTGAAVLVCPGGGYTILAMDLEGTEVIEWLNSIGVTGVLLKYRVPARKDRERYAAPLEDAQRALSLVRDHAKDWGINPHRIGVMGFSAGGHLAAVLSCNTAQRTYASVDAADQVSCRPDFVMLVYPAYLTVKEQGDKVAPELKITSDTPPTFLIQAEDDVVRVETSLFYYLALKQANVPAEMHLYPKGGHGYGLRPTADLVTRWPKRAEQWLRASGLLAR